MLLIGYGNSGRQDDGLGPAFANRIEAAGLPGLTVDIDYQLTVDHALAVAEADAVVFADALTGCAEPFRFDRAVAAEAASLGSHSLTPQSVLALARTLYDAAPEAHVLGISGRDFGMVEESLSSEALRNLDLAEAYFRDWYASQAHARADACEAV